VESEPEWRVNVLLSEETLIGLRYMPSKLQEVNKIIEIRAGRRLPFIRVVVALVCLIMAF